MWRQLKQTPSEFFKVDIGEGVQLDGWMMKPHDFDPQKRYPVLFYVYGEPWGQTVVDSWGGRNRLWHQMLAQQGYLVMSVDNRGTPAPRSRAWRKIIYRKMGIVNSGDQAAAARAIAQVAVRGCVSHRDLGLERWRFLDAECAVPLSGYLRYRRVSGAGRRTFITTTRFTRSATAGCRRIIRRSGSRVRRSLLRAS